MIFGKLETVKQVMEGLRFSDFHKGDLEKFFIDVRIASKSLDRLAEAEVVSRELYEEAQDEIYNIFKKVLKENAENPGFLFSTLTE